MRTKKTKGNGSGLDPNAWMVTFSDLLTLMLTFFVLLLSMSSMDNKRLTEAFGFFAGTQGGLEVEGEGAEGGVPVGYDIRYPSMYVLPPGALMSEAMPEIRRGWAEGPEGKTEPEKITQSKTGRPSDLEKELREGLRDLGIGEGVEIKRHAGTLLVRLSEGLLFDVGEARISFQGMIVLERCGEILARIPNRVRVEGHTDDTPIMGGPYRTNWELSTARAVQVLRFFTEPLGLDPQRFSAAGYGEYRPLVPNSGSENRAKNRRAEIVIQSSSRRQLL